MKILKRVLLILGIVILLIVVIGFCLPAKVHVERSMVMKAPANVIYDQVNILKNRENWSPWNKIDPNMGLTYAGPASGKGASYSWTSTNKKVGDGTLTIVDNMPDSVVDAEMDFKGHGGGTASFTFTKTADGTKVTWGMNSDMGMNPIARYFGAMMDKMIGPDFEKGLNTMKEIVEKMPQTGGDIKVEELTTTPMNTLTLNVKCTAAEISHKYDETLAKIMDYAKKSGLTPAGSPFAVFNKFSPADVDMDPGIPTDKLGKSEGDIKAVEMKAQKAIKVKYTGPYPQLKNAYAALDQYVKDHNMQKNGSSWEVYINTPMTEKDSTKLVTEVYYPVK